MFKLDIDRELIKKAGYLVETYDFGKRKEANGNKVQQLVGIIGEQVIRDLFKAGDIDGSNGFDGGYDIEYYDKLIDVKTMSRKCEVKDDFVSNFMELQLSHSATHFIFNSLNTVKKEITVCGYISKQEFLEKADYFPKGSYRYRTDGTSFQTFSGLYEIKNKYLHDVNGWLELIQKLKYDK